MAKSRRKKKPKASSAKRSRRRHTSRVASPAVASLPEKAAAPVEPQPKPKRQRAAQPKPLPLPTARGQLVRRGLAGAYALFALLFAAGLLANIHVLKAPPHPTVKTARRASWPSQLHAITTQISPAPATSTSSATLNVPILMYHKTPSDFDAQLDTLEQKNYHTITMAQLAAALHNLGGLPPKPVVITFDDGFADQMDAFTLLEKHHMVATYYIIDGGADSRWCIGAGRRYNDPSQPPTGCGDAYLNWNQVRQLDQSGIITIGSHTIDHQDLASDSEAQQQYEIIEGKHELEAQLGHPVYDFAYPASSFTAATVAIVQQAGFATAVTTNPGTTQTLDSIYTLERIRDPSTLP